MVWCLERGFVYNELVTVTTRNGVTSADILRYQVAIDIRRKNPLIVERGAPLVAKFTENLVPGKTYQVIFFLHFIWCIIFRKVFLYFIYFFLPQVVVKTVSGSVASWPATGNVTTRPLPVQNLRQVTEAETGEVSFEWEPHPESSQDSYRVSHVFLFFLFRTT